jgi:hypothetical protein
VSLSLQRILQDRVQRFSRASISIQSNGKSQQYVMQCLVTCSNMALKLSIIASGDSGRSPITTAIHELACLYIKCVGCFKRTPTIEDLLCHLWTHDKAINIDGSEQEIDLANEFCFGRHDYTDIRTSDRKEEE